jgi:ankyrin repeat protein
MGRVSRYTDSKITGLVQVDFMVTYKSKEEQRFFEAAYDEKTRLVARMLAKNPLLANSSNGIASPLYIAVRHKCHRMAEILIEYGADVNAGLLESGDQFSAGDTPLIAAIQSYTTRCMKLLIHHGAELNFINEWGYCPLTVAVAYYHLPLFRLLLKAGADPSLATDDGWRPIDSVQSISPESERRRYERLLAKYGADITLRAQIDLDKLTEDDKKFLGVC